MERKRITFRISESNYSTLEKYAQVMGVDKTRIINMALYKFFEKDKKQANEITRNLKVILKTLRESQAPRLNAGSNNSAADLLKLETNLKQFLESQINRVIAVLQEKD